MGWEHKALMAVVRKESCRAAGGSPQQFHGQKVKGQGHQVAVQVTTCGRLGHNVAAIQLVIFRSCVRLWAVLPAFERMLI